MASLQQRIQLKHQEIKELKEAEKDLELQKAELELEKLQRKLARDQSELRVKLPPIPPGTHRISDITPPHLTEREVTRFIQANKPLWTIYRKAISTGQLRNFVFVPDPQLNTPLTQKIAYLRRELLKHPDDVKIKNTLRTLEMRYRRIVNR